MNLLKDDYNSLGDFELQISFENDELNIQGEGDRFSMIYGLIRTLFEISSPINFDVVKAVNKFDKNFNNLKKRG